MQAVAEGGVFGDYEAVRHTQLHDFMLLCMRKAVQAQEAEREREKNKRS